MHVFECVSDLVDVRSLEVGVGLLRFGRRRRRWRRGRGRFRFSWSWFRRRRPVKSVVLEEEEKKTKLS